MVFLVPVGLCVADGPDSSILALIAVGRLPVDASKQKASMVVVIVNGTYLEAGFGACHLRVCGRRASGSVRPPLHLRLHLYLLPTIRYSISSIPSTLLSWYLEFVGGSKFSKHGDAEAHQKVILFDHDLPR